VSAPISIPGFLIGEQLPTLSSEAANPIATEPVDPARSDGDGMGRAVPAAKAAGRYPFVADLGSPGTLWAAVARSPHARATITGHDTKAALELPGVHAVLAGPDLGVTEVEYLGQCVALAAAEHPAVARAALDAILIEYRPADALTDPRQAFHAAPIHPDGNIAAHRHIVGPGEEPAAAPQRGASARLVPSPRAAQKPGSAEGGKKAGKDVKAAAARAAKSTAPVVSPLPGSEMPGVGEPPASPQQPGDADVDDVEVAHGYEFVRPADWPAAPGTVLAVPDGDRVEIHTLSADPQRDRLAVAAVLGRPEESIRLVPAPFTGGGIEDDADLRVAAAMLALRLGRPVKAVDGGVSHRAVGITTPAVRIHATHRCDADGMLQKVSIELVIDGGAQTTAAEALLDEYCRLAAGPYRVPEADIQGWVVRTNNPPLAAWPGGGAALAAVVAEAQMDSLAAELGTGALELRVKNLIRTGDPLPDGRRVAVGAPLPELIAALLEAPMPEFPPGPDVREFPGTVGRTGELTRLRRGVGLALAMIDLVPPGLAEERATAQVALTSDLHGPIAHVNTGMADTGAGQHALLRKIVREVLGVRRVLVRRPTDPTDLPATTPASGRAAWLHGMAVQRAARAVRTQALAIVAREFAVSPELLEVRGGQVVSYDGVLSRPLEQVYEQALRGAAVYLAAGEFRVRGDGPARPGVFVPEEGQAHVAFAAHRAVVDADTELGLLRPVRVTAAHDAGRVMVAGRTKAAVEAGIASAAAAIFAGGAAHGSAFGGAGDLSAAQLPSMLDLPEVQVLDPLESSIGELATTALRRRGFSAPLPLGYLPLGRISHAAAAAALACAARDALGEHRCALPIRPWSGTAEQQ
jgi:CO/xanthine dehydrogenase Mo-binding subunit